MNEQTRRSNLKDVLLDETQHLTLEELIRELAYYERRTKLNLTESKEELIQDSIAVMKIIISEEANK